MQLWLVDWRESCRKYQAAVLRVRLNIAFMIQRETCKLTRHSASHKSAEALGHVSSHTSTNWMHLITYSL